MLPELLARILVCTLGALYPAYATYKASSETKDDCIKWRMHWIVFAFFTCIECLTDLLLSWLPLYNEFKVALVLWLALPAGNGSAVIYRRYLQPLMKRYEARIDDLLERQRHKASNKLNDLLSRTASKMILNAIRHLLDMRFWRLIWKGLQFVQHIVVYELQCHLWAGCVSIYNRLSHIRLFSQKSSIAESSMNANSKAADLLEDIDEGNEGDNDETRIVPKINIYNVSNTSIEATTASVEVLNSSSENATELQPAAEEADLSDEECTLNTSHTNSDPTTKSSETVSSVFRRRHCGCIAKQLR